MCQRAHCHRLQTKSKPPLLFSFLPWVRLMCALRAHIKLSIFRNIFSKIEKVVITFSILKKIFSKIESLMCALRARISKIPLLLRVTTKQSTKAFRNKNLKSKRCRRMEGWAWRRRRIIMAGHFWNSAGDGNIIGYMVFSFTVNHLISIFLVFLLPSGIRFFFRFCQYNPVSSGTKSNTK